MRNRLYRTHVSRKRCTESFRRRRDPRDAYVFFSRFFSRKTLTIINDHDSGQRPLVSRRKNRVVVGQILYRAKVTEVSTARFIADS